MFAIYTTAGACSQAQFLSDMVALATGETNKANLSAGCNQAATSIFAGYQVAGWSVYDAAAGANAQTLRAQNQDGSTYKYATLNVLSAANFTFTLSESWNSGTHTGTNNCVTPNVAWAVSLSFYIYITSKNWFIWNVSNLVGSYIAEFIRLGQPVGYPCAVISPPNGGAGATLPGVTVTTINSTVPRAKNGSGAGDLTVQNVWLNPYCIGGTQTTSILSPAPYRATNESVLVPATSWGVQMLAAGTEILGTCYDFYQRAGGSTGDEISYNGVTYIYWPSGSIMVPKG